MYGYIGSIDKQGFLAMNKELKRLLKKNLASPPMSKKEIRKQAINTAVANDRLSGGTATVRSMTAAARMVDAEERFRVIAGKAIRGKIVREKAKGIKSSHR